MLGRIFNKSSNRPVMDMTRTYWDWFFDAASLVGLILMVSILIYYWPRLPETIPTHFNFSGEADGWGSKSTLLILPISGLALYAILTVVGFFPHTYNYPWKITEKNARDQYRLAQLLMGWLKIELTWMFLYLVWQTVKVSLGHVDGLGMVFASVFLAVVFGTIGIYFYLSFRVR